MKAQEEYPTPQITNSITYYLEGAFPSNIVASPLAYGNAELIKTTINFKYENYFIDRTSRQPNGYLFRSDGQWRDIRGLPFRRPPAQAQQPAFEYDQPYIDSKMAQDDFYEFDLQFRDNYGMRKESNEDPLVFGQWYLVE